jgi:pilus assembly protein Flp/PilA
VLRAKTALLHQHAATGCQQGGCHNRNQCRDFFHVSKPLKPILRDDPRNSGEICQKWGCGPMKSVIKRLIGDQAGATAIEYGLILALMVLAMMSALESFADGSISMWNNVSSRTADAISGSAS